MKLCSKTYSVQKKFEIRQSIKLSIKRRVTNKKRTRVPTTATIYSDILINIVRLMHKAKICMNYSLEL